MRLGEFTSTKNQMNRIRI